MIKRMGIAHSAHRHFAECKLRIWLASKTVFRVYKYIQVICAVQNKKRDVKTNGHRAFRASATRIPRISNAHFAHQQRAFRASATRISRISNAHFAHQQRAFRASATRIPRIVNSRNAHQQLTECASATGGMRIWLASQTVFRVYKYIQVICAVQNEKRDVQTNGHRAFRASSAHGMRIVNSRNAHLVSISNRVRDVQFKPGTK